MVLHAVRAEDETVVPGDGIAILILYGISAAGAYRQAVQPRFLLALPIPPLAVVIRR